MSVFTLTQYNVLVAAIAQGAREVHYADKVVKYGTLDEMLRTKALMESDLGITASNGRVVKVTYKSGLNDCGSESGGW